MDTKLYQKIGQNKEFKRKNLFATEKIVDLKFVYIRFHLVPEGQLLLEKLTPRKNKSPPEA